LIVFHIGQKVVCIDIRPNKRGMSPRYTDTVIPVLGNIYTIRESFDASPYGYEENGLLLVEIVNPARWYVTPTGRRVECEQFWLAHRFRPMRTTNIDVFLEMLELVRETKPLVDA
jgi:hypothetical protein